MVGQGAKLHNSRPNFHSIERVSTRFPRKGRTNERTKETSRVIYVRDEELRETRIGLGGAEGGRQAHSTIFRGFFRWLANLIAFSPRDSRRLALFKRV